eukprot:346157-Rhodomonas_salina.1
MYHTPGQYQRARRMIGMVAVPVTHALWILDLASISFVARACGSQHNRRQLVQPPAQSHDVLFESFSVQPVCLYRARTCTAHRAGFVLRRVYRVSRVVALGFACAFTVPREFVLGRADLVPARSRSARARRP